MKLQYISPETRSVDLHPESFICVSTMNQGRGTIDPVSELDLDSDDWETIL